MSTSRNALSSISKIPLSTAISTAPTSPSTQNSITVSQESEHPLRKWSSLLVLIFFTTSTSIVSQRSRSGVAGERYSIATSVFLSELLKLVVGFALAVLTRDVPSSRTDSASLPLFSEKADDSTADDQVDSPVSSTRASDEPTSILIKVRQAFKDIYCPSAWMMGIPALVYVLQNMLQLAANSYLSSVAYQALSQLKLVTAAFISVFLFGKTLSMRQWLCLPVLLTGVFFLTQKLPSHQSVEDAASLLRASEPNADSPFSHRHAGASTASTSKLMAQALLLASEHASAQLAIGTLCVLLACVCGGFAGVFIETKLKSSMSVALSVRNAQLASFALVTAGAAVLTEAMSNGQWAPLANFSMLAWITVLLRGASGYVVSATLRYADTIMKGFATSVAIITTIALESVLAASLPSLSQLVGSALVMTSTYNYVRSGSTSKS
ncbi:related to UDP N-acetylglucosamine transporter [Melanopsichium pennsylvanicum]|uniref:Related to UDP N-acetylglucosamine transporter n=2 Tax=Melanopsichium pennsylvanicum TaxID=63383 RepID=A0AAJ4XSB4_9BASI|nr:related to UDP N-acetylglucosamine transporter [Melanopsichium pennsylvanicum]